LLAKEGENIYRELDPVCSKLKKILYNCETKEESYNCANVLFKNIHPIPEDIRVVVLCRTVGYREGGECIQN
jgi:hypothetical protein